MDRPLRKPADDVLMTRRQVLIAGAAAGAGALVWRGFGHSALAQEQRTMAERQTFGLCLNTGTIRGQKLPLDQEIDLAAKAGYQAIEPWVTEISAYERNGGQVADLARRLKDAGLAMPSAIAFSQWIHDDDAARAKALEGARRDMDLVLRAGGTGIAAPPSGGTDRPVDLMRAAERFRALAEVGQSIGIMPHLELWGFSRSLSRLGEVAFVAAECAHPYTSVLLDAYHIYKGGSDFAGLRMFNGAAMKAFHINDYPADPPREKIEDQHRVYPGDGIAPLPAILRTLREAGFRGYLSLELFNREYWKQDALEVASRGLEKIKAVIAAAG